MGRTLRKKIIFVLLLAVFSAFACDDSGSSGSNTPPSEPETPVLNPPSAPGIATVVEGDSQLSLNWDEVDNADSYQVWISLSDVIGDATQNGGDIIGISHSVASLINGTTYYIWLRAQNTDGFSEFGPMASGTPEPDPVGMHYDAGTGNTLGSVPVDSNTYYPGDIVEVLDNSGALVGELIRDGIRQRFVEWNTQEDGSGAVYTAGDTFAITEDTTLYAIYTTGTDVLRKVGPAGGWIFYDAGSNQSWGRYMEAGNLDFQSQWSPQYIDLSGANGTAIGTGQQNTDDIISGDPSPNKAADRCNLYSVVFNGVTYNDWFLPSRDELNAIYLNLDVYGLGDFQHNTSYWSSTEYTQYRAYTQYFNTSIGQTDSSKKVVTYSRAVRAFNGL